MMYDGYPHAVSLHAIPSKSLDKIAPISAPFKQTLIISDSESDLEVNKKCFAILNKAVINYLPRCIITVQWLC